MKNQPAAISIRQSAITAGWAIVIMTIAAVMATDVTIGPLIVSEDPTATFENIMDHLTLFRVGVLSWIVVLICDIIAAWGLYFYFRPVNIGVSLISAWLRVVYTAMLGASIYNLNSVIELCDTDYHLSNIGYEQLESQTWLFLNSFNSSWSMGLIVFSLHIFFLGYLGFKSNYVPRIISILLIIGSVGYMIIHLSNLLIPQYQDLIDILGWVFILPMLSEVALGIWLLVKGKYAQTAVDPFDQRHLH